MRKTGVLYLIVTALTVFLLSGCGGGHGSGSGSGSGVSTADIKQVGVLTSPALEIYGSYKIYESADIKGMNGAQYFVAGDIGNESSQATLNLGFSEELSSNSSLAVVNASTGRVIFAYNPSGNSDTWKTGGNVSISGGKLLRYDSLSINQNQSTDVANIDIDDSETVRIDLSGSTATMTKDGTSTRVPEYDYVWHLDPDYRYEYFSIGINGQTVGDPENEIGYEELSTFKANDNSVYIARDIRYMPDSANFSENQTAVKDGETEYAAYYDDYVNEELAKEKGQAYAGPYIFATLPKVQGSSLSEVKALMTHSAEEAYNNPVLHITEDGVYSLSGTWNGQISIEADAVIILDGLTVTCTVAPAVVFKDSATEYAKGIYDDENSVSAASMDLGQDILDMLADSKANIVLIADGSTNTVTGANVYRIMKAEPKKSAAKVDGTDISDQKKLYKLDGAFYSYVSLAICGDEKGTGVLNITSSTLEGLDSELHLIIESGKINITAPDDGINVNEDDISVFTQLDGTLTIKSTKGDGIDSNGYIVIKGGNLNITAGNESDNANGEAGLDSEKGTYVSANANYTWTSASGGNTPTPPGGNIESGDTPPTPPDGIDSGDMPPSPPTPASNDVPGTNPVVSDDAPISQDVNGENDTDTEWQETQRENYNNTSDGTASKEEKYKYNDADVLRAAKQTDKGMTAINIGTGSSVSFIQADDDPKTRNISTSGTVFRLDRKVNTFSGIRSR